MQSHGIARCARPEAVSENATPRRKAAVGTDSRRPSSFSLRLIRMRCGSIAGYSISCRSMANRNRCAFSIGSSYSAMRLKLT